MKSLSARGKKSHQRGHWSRQRVVPPKPEPVRDSWWTVHALAPRSGEFYREALTRHPEASTVRSVGIGWTGY